MGDAAKKVVYDLRAGQVVLLENLRFHAEWRRKDDEGFVAKELAQLADIYMDDVRLGAVHRAHASVHALARMFRARACGFLLEKEIAALGKLVTGPEKPYVAVLGGAKVSDKIAVVEALLEQVSALCIGGAMANTFLAAKGVNVQASKVEGDKLSLARTILDKARERKVDVALPVDVVVAASVEADRGAHGPTRLLRDPRRDDGARYRTEDRCRTSRSASPRRRRSSGTGPWGSSRRRRSPRGPPAWRRRWPRPPRSP